MIEAVEESVIFTGDNVLNQTLRGWADGTFEGSIAACDKIAVVKAKHYVPGHGPTGDVTVVTGYVITSPHYLRSSSSNMIWQSRFEMKKRWWTS